MKRHSPKLMEKLGKSLLQNENHKAILGDLAEIYQNIVEEESLRKAKKWFWCQLIKSLPGIFYNMFRWHLFMIKHNFTMASRRLFRCRSFSLINTLGLSIGLMSSILAGLYVQHELSHDRFHKNADSIYRVSTNYTIFQNRTKTIYSPSPLASAAVNEIPGILRSTRIIQSQAQRVGTESHQFYENRLYYAESSFFQLFSIKLLRGNKTTVLDDPNSMVISEKAALKYFGNNDPIGQIVFVGDEKLPYKITGLTSSLNKPSHFHFDFLLSLEDHPSANETFWITTNVATYILLSKQSNALEIENKIISLHNKYAADQMTHRLRRTFNEFFGDDARWNYKLQPLTSIHLHSHLESEFETNGNVTHVILFAVIALLILIMACFNYINLSTAHALDRMKETGLKKVLGSTKIQLTQQNLSEAIIISILSMILTTAILTLFRDNIYQILGLSFYHSNTDIIRIAIFFLPLIIFPGLHTGVYQTAFISRFNAVQILKGQISQPSFRIASIRRLLVFIQFTISFFVIMGTLAVIHQLRFMNNKSWGINDKELIVLPRADKLGDHQELFRSSLLRSPDILSASFSSTVPGQNIHKAFYRVSDNDSDEGINPFVIYVDSNFTSVYEMIYNDGGGLTNNSKTKTSGILLNESALSSYPKLLKNPLGKQLARGGHFTIRGIVDDFHFTSMAQPVQPVVIHYTSGESHPFVSIRLHPAYSQKTIQYIKGIYKEILPDEPFDYFFLSDSLDQLHQNEYTLRRLGLTFSALSLLIAILGLIGLATYTTKRRTKEIGIRKVIGASTMKLILHLSNETVSILILSMIVALPIAFFLSTKWLETYAYKSKLPMWMFLFIGLTVVIIALTSITFHTVKTARANPVDVLRDE